jgi:hypothetical protein
MREVRDTGELRSIRIGDREADPCLKIDSDERILDVVCSLTMEFWA